MLIAKLKVTEHTPAGPKSRWRQKKEHTYDSLTLWVSMLQRSGTIDSGFIAVLENGKPGTRLYKWEGGAFQKICTQEETLKPFELELHLSKHVYNDEGQMVDVEESELLNSFATIEDALTYAKKLSRSYLISNGSLSRMKDKYTGERIAYWHEGMFGWY